MKKRVADYVAEKLAEAGIKHVFMVTGGGAMHLNDAFGRCKGLEYVACHHEQACAMAAESYYRMSNRLAAVNVTTGPGGTNALTGVYGAYVDSQGMVVISGQVKWETLVRSTQLPLRQLGDQEVDIIRIVEPVTKYAVIIEDPTTIRYHLEKALYLAQSGRPGPVWIDIPINIQGALIETDALKGFNPQEVSEFEFPKLKTSLVDELLKRFKSAKRPVVLAGSGIRLSGAYDQYLQVLDYLGVPAVTAWNCHDLLWDEHPLYCGRPGTIGDRPGNFVVQNSDFLLILGCRMNIRQISYNWGAFAREAFKVMVDIDEAELKKPTLKVDLSIHADVAQVMKDILKRPKLERNEEHQKWLQWSLERKRKYPVTQDSYWDTKNCVNPYCFIDVLTDQLEENERIVTGDGTACVVTFQAAKIKRGQRLYTNSGCASMGYDLPAALGAYFSEKPKRLICLAGDGSIQMNLQELQTIVTHRLPIKIFILNNQGYHSIRQTQQNYFPDNIVGCGTESGLGFPNYEKLASAYGISYQKISQGLDMAPIIKQTLHNEGPQICEVILDLNQQFAPKLSSKKLEDGRMVSAPLEDMAPFLDRAELLDNLIVKPLEN
ncbi:MAG: thiamine pyrophosphate-binding protein [Pseudomonadota bacterium]